jgi:tetratricopeptide (TPR) repeat protein
VSRRESGGGIGKAPALAYVLGAILLLVVAVALQVVRDRAWSPYRPAAAVTWLQPGATTNRLALGYRNFLADVYWMRTVVYYGGVRRTEGGAARNFDLLYPMLEMVTTLDPDFKVAYRFGAIFLTEAYPSGPGRPDQAIDLLQRAIARHPDGWEYVYDIAFVHYWWLRDYKGAAEWFQRAAAVPGAPEWLRPLAAASLEQGGDRELSRQMWRQIRDGSDVEWIKRSADQRLTQLDAMDRIDQLSSVVRRFKERTGRGPQRWSDLITAGLLPGVPLDPVGTPFVLDAATGAIDVVKGSPLWPLPTPQRAETPP